jgi:hypothetical protein
MRREKLTADACERQSISGLSLYTRRKNNVSHLGSSNVTVDLLIPYGRRYFGSNFVEIELIARQCNSLIGVSRGASRNHHAHSRPFEGP